LSIARQAPQVLMQRLPTGFFYVIDRQTGKLLSAEEIARWDWADHRSTLETGRAVEAARHPL